MDNKNNTAANVTILITADKGDAGAARGIASRSLRACKIKFTSVDYMSRKEARSYGGSEARYNIDMTPAQFEMFSAHVENAAQEEGWDGAPVDCYPEF